MGGAYRRGMLLGAFLGGCLAVCLLGAALSTDYWVVSSAKRAPPGLIHTESDGKIHFGLLRGVKELNVGYGWRNEEFSIREVFIDGGLIDYWLWIGVWLCLIISLLASVVGALLCLISSAAAPATAPPFLHSLTSVRRLYLAYSIGMIFEIVGGGLWTWGFHSKLRYNIMSEQDRAAHWTSEGLSFLGHSYWLVVICLLVHLISIIFIYSGTSEMRQNKAVKPVLHEKPNGNIMLY